MKIKAQIDRMVGENNRIKAYASVILGGEYVVRDIAVMDSKNGLFARMPYRSYKDRNGDMKYSDTVFAMNETSRNAINAAVLAAYEQRLHMELTQKERKSLKIFNTKNAFYNFVWFQCIFRLRAARKSMWQAAKPATGCIASISFIR